MPACYMLIRKGENTPTKLAQIDEEMCAFFHVIPHPNNWYRNWENTIGLSLAVGNDWKKTREIFPEDTDIINWLEENFVVESWYQRS